MTQQLVLFFDWDETVSNDDTLGLIAPPDDAHPGQPFSAYTQAYLNDLQSHDEQYEDKERSTIEAQLRYLESLDEVELKSQRRIENGGLFVRFDPEEMELRAKRLVRLRPGWKEMISTGRAFRGSSGGGGGGDSGVEYHFISVGWSARFIKAALQASSAADSQEGKASAKSSPPPPQPTSICANEIEIDEQTQRGTGRLTKSSETGESKGRFGIRIAQHKVREMNRILAGRKEAGVVKTIVYGGDSNTDLPCLLEADVGLILGGNTSLLSTINRLGLGAHLCNTADEWLVKRRKATDATTKPDLIVVKDWFEGAQVVEALRAELEEGSS